MGGNARLTLSASRTMVGVDFAVAFAAASTKFSSPPSSENSSYIDDHDAAVTTARAAGERVRRPQGQGDAARAGRAWVTRRFLVGSSVPPEFSHALSVAFSCVEGGEGLAGGAGEGGELGGEEGGEIEGRGAGLVASELPLPEERPDHAR